MNLPEFLTRDTDGFIHMTGSRVGLQHLIHYYNDGYSPEMLASEYPSLSLALIHKVIAFYLENQGKVDAYIASCRAESEQHRRVAQPGPGVAELRRRLAARQQIGGG